MRKDVGVKTAEIDINTSSFLRYTPIIKDLPVNVNDHLFGKAHVIAYILYLHSSVSIIFLSLSYFALITNNHLLRKIFDAKRLKEKRNLENLDGHINGHFTLENLLSLFAITGEFIEKLILRDGSLEL